MNPKEYNFENIIYGLQHSKYRYIGAGSSRRVYDLGNGFVVKVAKNYRGIRQNTIEFNVYKTGRYKILAPILSISTDSRLLIMRKGERITNFATVLHYYKAENMRQLTNGAIFLELKNKYQLAGGDLMRLSSWGMVNQIPMLVDYGFSSMPLDK